MECDCCDQDPCQCEDGMIVRLRARVAELEAELQKAVELRVSLYRHSDMDGDTDNLSDNQVAAMDPFAKKWAPLLDL